MARKLLKSSTGKRKTHGSNSVHISSIAALVKQGKTVIAGDDSILVAAVTAALNEKRPATFYVTPAQYTAIMKLHWTPKRLRETGMKTISRDETKRIKSDLKVDVSGSFSPIKCPSCGHVYGMYEFLQQGIEEHGRAMVEGILSRKDVSVIRVNPIHDPVCRNCKKRINADPSKGKPIYYKCIDGYGCCMTT